MRLFSILLLVVLFASSVFSQERFVRPVDGAKKDASFTAFRSRLIKAAEKRDSKYILSIVDRNIKIGFGEDNGIADFKRVWKLVRRNSDFWDEFLKAIRNGGDFDNKLFTAPYTFSSWPDDVDGFDYNVIFGNNVNLREAPSADAKVIGKLSYNVVKVDFEKSAKVGKPGTDQEKVTWYQVTTMGGLTGFVSSEYVRSHIDYRAGFEKKRGAWKMVFFLAGD